MRLPQIHYGNVQSLGRYDTSMPARLFSTELSNIRAEQAQRMAAIQGFTQGVQKIAQGIQQAEIATAKAEVDKALLTYQQEAATAIDTTPEINEDGTPFWKNPHKIDNITTQARNKAVKFLTSDLARREFEKRAELLDIKLKGVWNRKLNTAKVEFTKQQNLETIQMALDNHNWDLAKEKLSDPHVRASLTPAQLRRARMQVSMGERLDSYTTRFDQVARKPQAALELKQSILDDPKLPPSTKKQLVHTSEVRQKEDYLKGLNLQLRTAEKTQGIMGAYDLLEKQQRWVLTATQEQLGGNESYRQALLSEINRRRSQYKELYHIKFRQAGESLAATRLLSGAEYPVKGISDKAYNKGVKQMLWGDGPIDLNSLVDNEGLKLKQLARVEKQRGWAYQAPTVTKALEQIVQAGNPEQMAGVVSYLVDLHRTNPNLNPRFYFNGSKVLQDFDTFVRAYGPPDPEEEKSPALRAQYYNRIWQQYKEMQTQDPLVRQERAKQLKTADMQKYFDSNLEDAINESMPNSAFLFFNASLDVKDQFKAHAKFAFDKWYQMTGNPDQALKMAINEVKRNFMPTDIGAGSQGRTLMYRPPEMVIAEQIGGKYTPEQLRPYVKDALGRLLRDAGHGSIDLDNVSLVPASSFDPSHPVAPTVSNLGALQQGLQGLAQPSETYMIFETDPDTGQRRYLATWLPNFEDTDLAEIDRIKRTIDSQRRTINEAKNADYVKTIKALPPELRQQYQDNVRWFNFVDRGLANTYDNFRKSMVDLTGIPHEEDVERFDEQVTKTQSGLGGLP